MCVCVFRVAAESHQTRTRKARKGNAEQSPVHIQSLESLERIFVTTDTLPGHHHLLQIQSTRSSSPTATSTASSSSRVKKRKRKPIRNRQQQQPHNNNNYTPHQDEDDEERDENPGATTHGTNHHLQHSEQQQNSDSRNMTTDTKKRVKLYALNAERQWDDRGTGHVSSQYVERLKGMSLLVRAESDGSLLLESKIQPDTAYQKQQDTLIVWSEGDNFDLALSFQEKVGCDEIWEKICHVQGKDPSVEVTQDIVEESEDERFDEMSDSAPPIELPPCELSRLEDISEAIASGLATPVRKEKLAVALESEGYIEKLLNLFHVCEDLDNIDGLHHLFEIFKNIFLLNKNALFEIMFSEDTIFDVVGCLEFDPSLTQRRKHRQYLRQLAKFREAIPIRNKTLLAKIHQTYRVQYIQDVVLPTPSVFMEDNMVNTLSSFIFFNKVEIVTLIQEDETFLVDLFNVLRDRQTPDLKRRDIVLFLKEFCNFAGNLQPLGKDTFYKTLISLGVLPALEITLAIDDQKTKSASIDILTSIVEYSPSLVRDYTIQQDSLPEPESMLVNIAIMQMLSDSEPELGGAVQIMGILRILLDPENMLTSANKSEKTDFLNFFYKYSIRILVGPLIINTAGDKPKEDYHTAQLLGLILELLSFCVEHHTYHIKNFILQKDLLERILVLMKSNHTFLVLGALRFVRKAIAMKDEFYNRQIIRCNLFAPIVDAFLRNNGRYNLLESAILEFFEFIKVEDIKSLCTYFVEKFGKIFDDIEYVQTFKGLRTKYDQQQERFKDKILDSIPMIRTMRRRDPRQMDEEEEMWFQEDDDFSDMNNKDLASTLDDVVHNQKISHNTSPPTVSAMSAALGAAGVPTQHSQMQQQQQQQSNAHNAEGTTTATTVTGADVVQGNNKEENGIGGSRVAATVVSDKSSNESDSNSSSSSSGGEDGDSTTSSSSGGQRSSSESQLAVTKASESATEDTVTATTTSTSELASTTGGGGSGDEKEDVGDEKSGDGAAKKGLVDYDGDSEEEAEPAEDDEDGDSAPQQKKARLD